MIYFIRPVSGKHIKIGTTITLPQRLRALADEFGELEVLAVADGTFPEESGLHKRFAHLRAFGEWFEPGDDLLAFIVSEAKPWDGVDECPTKSIMSFSGTDEMRQWVDELVEHSRLGTRALLLRNALRHLAKEKGFAEPMPKR